MNKVITILSIILIIMSIVLLLVTPFAVLGIIFGVLGIIYGRYYEKHSEEIKASSTVAFERLKKAQVKQKTEVKRQEPSVLHFTEKIPVTGVSARSIRPFWVGEEDIERETVMYYERGNKIFRNVYSFDNATISVVGKDVLVNGNPFAHLLPKNLEKYELFISEHPDSWLSLDVSFGHYAEIVRNPDYDRDIDDEDEQNMVVYDDLEKPRGTLSIHYTTERSIS